MVKVDLRVVSLGSRLGFRLGPDLRLTAVLIHSLITSIGSCLLRLLMASKVWSYFEGREFALHYAKTRPSYPSVLIENIMGYLRSQLPLTSYDKMLDVGCGTGQATRLFAPYFESILGIDVSADQVRVGRETTKMPNISYQVGNGHSLPSDDGTIDFVNCATAAHWLDIPRFVSECERVLKPGGCVAIYVSHPVSVGNPVSKLCHLAEKREDDWLKLFGEFFATIKAFSINETWMNGYRSVYEEIRNPSKSWLDAVSCEKEVSWKWFRDFISSLGSYRTFMRTNRPEQDPAEEFFAKVKAYLGVEDKPEDEITVVIVFSFPTIVFSKRNDKD